MPAIYQTKAPRAGGLFLFPEQHKPVIRCRSIPTTTHLRPPIPRSGRGSSGCHISSSIPNRLPQTASMIGSCLATQPATRPTRMIGSCRGQARGKFPLARNPTTPPIPITAIRPPHRWIRSRPIGRRAGIVGGYAGGQLGAVAGPVGVAGGALIGGSLGAAALSAAQTLGPVYAAELKRTSKDPEGAWNRAWRQAEIAGAFSGASWAAFPVRFFQSPVKHLVFQMFGVQPALAVGQTVTSNIAEGRPATEGIGDAYSHGVVGTAIPALGHKVVGSLLRTRAPAGGVGRVGETSGEAPVQAAPPERSSATPQSLRSAEETTKDTVQDERATGGFGGTRDGTTPKLAGAREQSSSATRDSRSASGLNAKPRSRGVWDLSAALRGRILEKIFGHNLHPNHPTIDIWDPSTGAVTSLKSIDLEAPGYQVEGKYANALYNKLSRDLNKLAEFEGGRYAGTDVRDVTSRSFTLIIPSLGTAEQRQVLRNVIEIGKQRGVIANIEVYR